MGRSRPTDAECLEDVGRADELVQLHARERLRKPDHRLELSHGDAVAGLRYADLVRLAQLSVAVDEQSLRLVGQRETQGPGVLDVPLREWATGAVGLPAQVVAVRSRGRPAARTCI